MANSSTLDSIDSRPRRTSVEYDGAKKFANSHRSTHADILDKIQCPDCQGSLADVSPESLTCHSCGRAFKVENGIYNLLPVSKLREPEIHGSPLFKKLRSVLDGIHEEHYRKESASRKFEDTVKKYLMRFVDTESKRELPVDFGCGTGTGIDTIGQSGRILGIDNEMSLLRTCAKQHPNATLVCCDMRKPPFKTGALRTVFTVATLEHVFYLEEVVENLSRILAKDGTLYVLVPTEGGLAWGLARSLITSRKYGHLGLDRQTFLEAMKIEHCNTVFSIDCVLRKFFQVDRQSYWPFRIGGAHFNLYKIYRLSSLANKIGSATD